MGNRVRVSQIQPPGIMPLRGRAASDNKSPTRLLPIGHSPERQKSPESRAPQLISPYIIATPKLTGLYVALFAK